MRLTEKGKRIHLVPRRMSGKSQLDAENEFRCLIYNKLSKLEDILEKYGLNDNLEGLDHRLDENLTQFTQMGYGNRTWKDYHRIEIEFGIDLITLFKLINAKNVYSYGHTNIMKNTGQVDIHDRTITIWNGSCHQTYPLSEYGKSFALTKEELL